MKRPITNIEAVGTAEFIGRYERPDTMAHKSVPWEQLPIPEHVAQFYPKLRVPRKWIPDPNWKRIMDEISALRIAQGISPTKYSEREYKMSEDRIHERDHERRMARALVRWQEEKEKGFHNHITEELWDSTDEARTTSRYETAPAASLIDELKRD